MRKRRLMLLLIIALIIPLSIVFQSSASTNYVSVVVIYTDDYVEELGGNPITNASTSFTAAKWALKQKWDIELTPQYFLGSPVCINFCSLSIDTPCNSTCGINQNLIHTCVWHKNLYQNHMHIKASNLLGSNDLLMTLTGAKITGGVLGLGDRNGDYTTVSHRSDFSSTLKVRIMQHEFSHNFCCYDSRCAVNEACIMNGGFDLISPYAISDIWCTKCRTTFNRTAH